MKLQLLISTMHQKNYELIKKMNVQTDAIVINQCDENSIQSIKVDNAQITWINSKGRGLSCSRNLALKKATGNICVFADDDLEYLSDYKDIIIEQFNLYPDADIITFQVEGIEGKFKNYYPKARKINYLTSMKISSVEVAFKLNGIIQANVSFNELFGAGAKYYMSEENIFLMECLRRGMKIMYVPVKIANLHIGTSTWFKGYNKEYFINKGAAFAAMSNKLSALLIIQYAVRKAKLFNDSVTIYDAIKYMFSGRKNYLKENKYGNKHKRN